MDIHCITGTHSCEQLATSRAIPTAHHLATDRLFVTDGQVLT